MTDMERYEYMQKMAENLPALTTKLSMTQEDLANLIGVSRSTVIFFEKNNGK